MKLALALLLLTALAFLGIEIWLPAADTFYYEPFAAGPPIDAAGTEVFTKPHPYRFWVQVAVSAVAFGAALFIILSARYPAETHKWAYGTAGTVLGYWLA